jgi:hypothetical protein
MNVHDLIASARPQARTVELCLRGDLVADLEDTARRLAVAKSRGDNTAQQDLEAEVTRLRATMAESVIVARLEAMPRAVWLSLLAEHPPRDGDAVDRASGFNTATFYEAVVRGSWSAPDLPPADLDALLAAVNDGQWQELAEAAFTVNTRGAVVPPTWRPSSGTPS